MKQPFTKTDPPIVWEFKGPATADTTYEVSLFGRWVRFYGSTGFDDPRRNADSEGENCALAVVGALLKALISEQQNLGKLAP